MRSTVSGWLLHRSAPIPIHRKLICPAMLLLMRVILRSHRQSGHGKVMSTQCHKGCLCSKHAQSRKKKIHVHTEFSQGFASESTSILRVYLVMSGTVVNKGVYILFSNVQTYINVASKVPYKPIIYIK